MFNEKLMNVFGMDGQPWRPPSEALYGHHLQRTLSHLFQLDGGKWARMKYLVYFHPTHKPLPQFPAEGKDWVLIFLSDETAMIPRELSPRYFAILKTYWPLESPLDNMIPFPLGTSNAIEGMAMVPFESRRYDVSFTGNFVPHRLDFYRQFTPLRWLPPFPIRGRLPRTAYWKLLMRFFRAAEFPALAGSSRIYFSGGFGSGLPRSEYAETLAQSKIALCPMGYLNTECWRVYEAMKLGCVIVADELPPSRWYRGAPIVIERNWLGIRRTVWNLLGQPERLLELHEASLRWWRDVCSEEASARYVARELGKLGNVDF